MKTRLILFILLFISGFAIAGCKQQNQYRPDAKIVAAFNNKYPQSDKVEWEQKQGYYVAEFREDGIEHEAWFDGTGKWVMTESNLRYSSLPQAIREQFEKSVYSTWKKDDIDKIWIGIAECWKMNTTPCGKSFRSQSAPSITVGALRPCTFSPSMWRAFSLPPAAMKPTALRPPRCWSASPAQPTRPRALSPLKRTETA